MRLTAYTLISNHQYSTILALLDDLEQNDLFPQ